MRLPNLSHSIGQDGDNKAACFIRRSTVLDLGRICFIAEAASLRLLEHRGADRIDFVYIE